MVRLGRAPLKARLETDLNKIAERLRVSLPIMRASVSDQELRNLLLAQLVSLNCKESRTLVLPENTLAHVVDQRTFDEYRNTLGGLTASNREEVQEKLAALGIDGRGQVVARRAGGRPRGAPDPS